ncbi:MAG: sulfurtransferase, partial [Burkholderia sp.]|nr:sulfurtransferase [Burkholderia sp.]
MQNLTAPALAEWLADTSRPAPVLLDVREPWEIQTAAMPGIVSIPMREIPARSEELDDDAQIVC